MRKIFISILLASSVLTSCKITDKNEHREVTADMIEPENPPMMVFEKETFEFNDLAVGSTLKSSFKFTNKGKSALILFDVKASCGCTVLNGWPKEPIAPGKSAEIPFEFTPNVTGQNNKTISIVANTVPSTKKLIIKGTVIGTN